MNRQELIEQVKKKQSVLCVGLDTDFDKLPLHLKSLPLAEALLRFNREIIDATAKYTISYKINTAFYEQYGSLGWDVMRETLAHIPKDCFTIADAKRGDIGNTSKMYAKAFFETLNFDAVTVAPYMGYDSVAPFLEYANKWVICLGLTSNSGSQDLQQQTLQSGKSVYMHTLDFLAKIGDSSQMMFVTGATKASQLKEIRALFPHYFFLVPGVGAQGGTVKEVCDAALIPDELGLLINSSRGILYKSDGLDFATAAADEAQKLVKEMKPYF